VITKDLVKPGAIRTFLEELPKRLALWPASRALERRLIRAAFPRLVESRVGKLRNVHMRPGAKQARAL